MAHDSDISTIGYWSEVKLDIIHNYASAYSRILAAQKEPSFRHVYIDGFSGAGFHLSRISGELVWGSPTSVLLVEPPFCEYHFIDLDRANIDTLQQTVLSRTSGPYDPQTVHFYNADCNEVLISKVFPRVSYEKYCRGLCLLDPYGLHLDWEVIQTAGKMGTIEIFLNFPIHDMNRNVLLKDLTRVDERQLERLNKYWGDESWRDAAYSNQGNLFGYDEKTTNEAVVSAFRARLEKVAEFKTVPEPMPMTNSRGAVLYYLIFASQKPVAAQIVTDIFNKYRDHTE
jgi:three-Cys-motif partner protein